MKTALAALLALAASASAQVVPRAHVVRRPSVGPYPLGGVRLSVSKGPEVNASQDTRTIYSETSIAINPANPARILGGSNHLQGGAPMAGFLSDNRGATFRRLDPGQALGGTFYGDTTDPCVAFDAAGNGYYAFLMASSANGRYRPVVAVLPSGASAWTGPYAVSATIADDDKSMMTTDISATSPYRNRAYMVWDRNAADGTQSVWLGRSDGGVTWQTPVRLDDTATSSGAVIYADPACGPNGEVYVVWNDYGVGGGSLQIDRSTDGGKTFGLDAVVSDLRLNLQPDPADPRSVYAIPAQPQRGIAACPSVGVDISTGPRRGWVYVCYNDVAPGHAHDDTDVFVRRSTDGGVTWSGPVRVNDDATTTSQFWPWMSVDPVDGSLNITFYDCRDDPASNTRAHVYYARSRDGGATFEPNTRITTVPSDQSTGTADPLGNDYGDYEGVVAFGGQVAAIWTDSRFGYNQAVAEVLVQPGSLPTGLRQTACGTIIPAGGALSTRAVNLSATLDGPSPGLIAQWEVKPAGAPFDAAGLIQSPPVAYSGAPVIASAALANLAGGGYHWRVRAVRQDGLCAPGDWASPGGAADFVIGGAPVAVADAARALRIAAGGVAAAPADMLRLDVSGSAGAPGCDGSLTIRDAVRLARSVAGLDAIP